MENNNNNNKLHDASYLHLIGTGTMLGIVHILTGPDHISALATLSVGSSWRSFTLGIRWGCGHSIGLIIIAIIFICLDGKLNLDSFNILTDLIVGIFMLLLGLYGILNSIKEYNKKQNEWIYLNNINNNSNNNKLNLNDQIYRDKKKKNFVQLNQLTPSSDMIKNDLNNNNKINDLENEIQNKKYKTNTFKSVRMEDIEDNEINTLEMQENNNKKNKRNPIHYEMDRSNDNENDNENDMDFGCDNDHNYENNRNTSRKYIICLYIRRYYNRIKDKCSLFDLKDPNTQKFTSLCIGIIHGIAGPGGILGVLPAVGLHNTFKSFTYLISFCITSILIMGLFASCYGEFTGKLGNKSIKFSFLLSLFSSFLSVLVGCLWLILLYFGKLKDVFG